jgi:hypothetical protein
VSKEQKHLKPCHILDRLREWFELYGNQNHQRAEEELHLAIDELYEYQQKDKQLADLQQEQIAEMKEHQEAMELADNTINNLVEDNRASQEWYKKQLAEHNKYFKSFSCEDFNEFKDFISTFMLTPHEEQTLILELKQQLAKKEEQVRKSQEIYFETLKELDELEDNFNNTSLELWAEKLITQDKILFAVEQLEKVKRHIIEDTVWELTCENALEIIDNQIKRLNERE